MAKLPQVSILSDSELLIENLQIKNTELINILKDFQQNNTRNELHEKIISLIEQGMLVDKAIPNFAKSDVVEAKFAKLKSDFDNTLTQIFPQKIHDELTKSIGSDGEFMANLDKKFGRDGEYQTIIDQINKTYQDAISKMIDEKNTESPFYKITKQIEDIQRESKQRFDQIKIFKDTAASGTKKGTEFENEIHSILQEMFSSVHFSVTLVRSDVGRLGNSKAGDFVIEELSTGKRVVIDTKEQKRLTATPVDVVLENCLKNREADFAILLHLQEKTDEIVPLGSFNHFSEQKLFASLDMNDSYNYNKKILSMVLRYGIAMISKKQEQPGDLKKFLELRENIRARLDLAKKIKKEASDVKKKGDTIEGHIDKIIESIEDDLEKIREIK